MSKIIASCAIRGAREIYRQADEFLEKAIKEKGESCEVKFPDTAFYFPFAYALLGEEVKKLSDAENLKLFATSVAIVGFSVMGSSIGIQEATDHETLKQVMFAPVSAGAAIAGLGLFMFLNARLTAQEIFYEAKQRGLKIVPGMHRSFETPQE